MRSLSDVRLETKEALKQVDEHADPTWKDDALEAVRLTCLAYETFISDDVWKISDLRPAREDRALGPVMMRAKRNGWCIKTDRVRPSLRSHLSGKPVWRSLLR